MNNSKIVNDDVITVVPRIIDPNMKFTKESIQNIELKNKNSSCKVDNSSTNNENSTSDENIITLGFFAKYKTYIFVIIIIILLICIIFLIYKYFTNKKKKEIENETTFNKVDNVDTVSYTHLRAHET
jgi:hypothetical protein